MQRRVLMIRVPTDPERPDLAHRGLDRLTSPITDAVVLGTDPATGLPEVNFGFTVEVCDVAEQIVRDAVAGTEFAAIREIARFGGHGADRP